MRQLLSRIFRNQRGATAIEYGLIVSLIAILTIASLTTIGTTLNTRYGNIATDVHNAG
jgi:pilus assembly protein Flp/PilA